MTRRVAVAGISASVLGAAALPALASPPPDWAPRLEQHFGGKLGVSVLDTANGKKYAHRGDERFLMCSVFKMLMAGLVLSRAEHGKIDLTKQIPYTKADLLDYAPVTTQHVAEGHMSLHDLVAAAATESDNTAANLVMAQIGGPAAITAYARSIGDDVTRCDRIEPALNLPEGDKDTTSPNAMLEDLHALTFGYALSPKGRATLGDWLAASHTGDAAIKAGIPDNWRRAGKTGNGEEESNDVVVLYPSENRPAILVSAFYFNAAITGDARRNVLMEVGRAVAANFG